MSKTYRLSKPGTPEGKAMSARHIKSGRKVQKLMLKAYQQQFKTDTEHSSEHDASAKDAKKKIKDIKKMLKGKYASSRSPKGS